MDEDFGGDGVVHLARGFRIERQRPGSWSAYQGSRWAGSINVADGLPFVSSARLEAWAREAGRGIGLGAALYDAVEADIGRPLVPSPLGIMDDAAAFWRKRLERFTPEERRAMFEEARAIGHGYGLGDASVVSGRLDRVFDMDEVSPAAVGGMNP